MPQRHVDVAAARRRLVVVVRQPEAELVAEPRAAGPRWWSIFESLWTNYTLFDRARPRLALQGVRTFSLDDTAVFEAAEYLGLQS